MKKISYLYFDELASTNDKLLSIAPKSEPFTVVYTFKQTHGKGFGENKWKTNFNENLTFSFLLSFDLDALKNITQINFWVISELHKFIISKINQNHSLKIKWPNDLILNKKKIAGLLIENKIIGNKINCIVGIGLNVNQEKFENLPNASSLFAETGIQFHLNQLLNDLMNHFLNNFTLLLNEPNDALNYFNEHLFKKEQVACFEKDKIQFNGIVKKVDENGKLIVLKEDDTLQKFEHKQIALLF